MNPVDALKQNPFVLAPMAAITDHPFRSFIKKLGASVVVSELVSSNGIEFKSERTLKLMSFDKMQSPVGIQLFGEDPEMMGRAAKVVEDMGADFVDINFGCPVPKVVKKGAGSACLKDLPHLTRVVRGVVSAVKIPVTIKVRTGWDANSMNAHEVAHIAHNEGVAWMAIHGRTRAQAYSGDADWNYIARVKAESKIPIIGNGDIHTPEMAVKRLKESGCDGVMIGRGCLKNPYIFMDAMSLWKGEERNSKVNRDFSQVLLDLRAQIVGHCDEHVTGIQLRKFAAWFATGYPGASQFRRNIFNTKNNDEIMTLAMDFFATIETPQADTSQEAFLMGGHG